MTRKSLRIGFDGSAFNHQRAGGINRYFCVLIPRLPHRFEPVVYGTSNFGSCSVKHLHHRVLSGLDIRPKGLGLVVRQVRWTRLLDRGLDVIHPTFLDLVDNLTIRRFKAPLVVTVYDLIYANNPHLFDDAASVIATQRELVLHAEAIVCISKYAEGALLTLYPSAAVEHTWST